MCTCMHRYLNMYEYITVCACMSVCIYMCMCIRVCTGISICTCVKKVHLVSCNTMMIPSTLQGSNEYVCRDFDDLINYEQHCPALIIDTLIREMKYETKQYEGLVILDSPPQYGR